MSEPANAEHPSLHLDETYFTTKAAKNFPTARYFQVHFEFLQEQIQLLKATQEAMLMQMSQLEQCLLIQQQHLFSDDLHPFAARHSSVTLPPVKRYAGLRAGIKKTKKG